MTSQTYSPVAAEKFSIEIPRTATTSSIRCDCKKCLMILFFIVTLLAVSGGLIYYFMINDTPLIEEVPSTPRNPSPKQIQQHDNFHLFSSENCHKLSTTTRIQHGEIAKPKEFPFMAVLFIEIERNYQGNKEVINGCGGSLISPYLVLTAAHCVIENYNRKL